MESNFRNRDFEQYVKQNADQYRMFPSEKVWKGIHGSLHTRRKWYGLGLALLLLSTVTAVTWVMVSYPVSNNQRITGVIPTKDKAPVTAPASSQELVENTNTENLPFSIKQATPSADKPNPSTIDFSAQATENDILIDETAELPGLITDAGS